MNSYKIKVLDIVEKTLRPIAPVGNGLDFGCGDGWFTSEIRKRGLIPSITPIDITHRKNAMVEPLVYGGGRLPFDDRQFGIVYAIDVLHHCDDPLYYLDELLRCSGDYLMLKDHTYRTIAGKLGLSVLDELGNRRFGIPCLYQYQRKWTWFPIIEKAGFELVTLVHPAPCHWGLMKPLVNPMEFVGLWKRREIPPASRGKP